MKLGDSLESEEALHATFLSALAARRILDKAERTGAYTAGAESKLFLSESKHDAGRVPDIVLMAAERLSRAA